MIIGLTSDLHLPRYYKEFVKSLDDVEGDLDALFILGDLTDAKFHYIRKIYDLLKKKFDTEIYALFGNNEYIQYRDYIKKNFSEITWIDDEIVKIGNKVFIGTEGILDSLTPWMVKNMPWIKDFWDQRLRKIENLMEEASKIDKDFIFLSHYSPFCKTVEGDPAPKIYLCSKRMEGLIYRYKPRFVFHGHAHYAKIWKWKLDKTEIYNVAFPIHKRILVLEI